MLTATVADLAGDAVRRAGLRFADASAVVVATPGVPDPWHRYSVLESPETLSPPQYAPPETQSFPFGSPPPEPPPPPPPPGNPGRPSPPAGGT